MPKSTLKSNEAIFAVRDYDLAATLCCGQAFRWEFRDDRWQGVVGENWVVLEQRFPSAAPPRSAKALPLSPKRFAAASRDGESEGERARVNGQFDSSAAAPARATRLYPLTPPLFPSVGERE